jgi:ABC-2 type transport system ATP-binding protein
VRDGLRQFSDEDGTALLITSHDMNEVAKVCDRVVFLSHGRIVADGTPDEIAEHYGHGDLEGVFLELAQQRHDIHDAQQTDHPL